ncbi:hypothetical protein [Rhizobium sp. FKY42]|uniref:hypothetical protein n=1 Tax=Rhizobium sp. FKY42 TaxID=2562310 RepID=UPI0010C00A0E|nr:hypothetical protein [Rhizobium sp. FKY42]
MALQIKWADVSGLQRMDNALKRLDSHAKHLVLQRAVNHTGDKARTRVIRALAKQTGLSQKVIRKAVRTGRAWGAGADIETFTEGRGSLTYTLSSKGGDISLKYFKPRETRAGVTAAPFGVRKLFPGRFTKGGKFPERKTAATVLTKKEAALHGHVYNRAGKARTPLEFNDSGVVIPAEMLKGETARAFTAVVETDLPPRVIHEIERLVPGFFD